MQEKVLEEADDILDSATGPTSTVDEMASDSHLTVDEMASDSHLGALQSEVLTRVGDVFLLVQEQVASTKEALQAVSLEIDLTLTLTPTLIGGSSSS